MSPGKFLKCQKYGLPKVNFLLPPVPDSSESIFRYFNYEYIHEKSTAFDIASRHVYWDQEKS
jgi:hypothetical protein